MDCGGVEKRGWFYLWILNLCMGLSNNFLKHVTVFTSTITNIKINGKSLIGSLPNPEKRTLLY